MRRALSAKNKWPFVNGSIARPASASTDLSAWERCNDMVVAWILNCLSPDIQSSVNYTDLAKDV